MPSADIKEAKAQATFLPTMRELARAYQAFANYSDSHIRKLGLTPSQFDVIATLGNTEGMSMKALAEATLVTKGTLTGIVDRIVRIQTVCIQTLIVSVNLAPEMLRRTL